MHAHAFISTEICFAIPSSEPQPPQPPPQQQQPNFSPQECPCVRVTFRVDGLYDVDHWVDTVTAAARRRHRRLRAYMRYARMSVAMALAESTHHTSLKGSEECQDRGVGARDELHGDVPGPPSLTIRSSSASTKKSPAGGGQGRSRTLRRSPGLGGPLASTLSRSVPTFRFSTCLCRRWGSGGGVAAHVRRAECRTGYRSAQDLF